VALVLAAVPAWAKPSVAELAHQCDFQGKQKACRELAKLAEHDKDTSIRIQAIGKLNDESVLERIVEQELFPAVRQAAEARLKTIRTRKPHAQTGGGAGAAARVSP
jgi:hypothetical protein